MADTQPNSVDAEKSLLACLLIEPKDYLSICISSKLVESDFYTRSHWYIYKAILTLYNSNRLIDCVTVSDELSKMWQLDYIWGIDYLWDLVSYIMSTSWFIDWLKIVKEKSALRNIITMINSAKAKAMSQWDSEQILAWLRTDFYKFLNNDVIDSGWCSLEEAYDKLVDDMENWWLEPICRTWFKSIDDYVSGFTETAIWVIWARSSQGKSTFAHNLLMNAVNQWVKVCLFSMEMNRAEVVQKVTSMIWWIPSQAYKWKASPELLERLKETKTKAKQMLRNFIIFDKINRYEHICNEIYAQAGQWVKLFCVDHVLLIKWDKKSSNNARDIWEIVNGFKQVAQELGVCIILISQFNRDQDKRMDPDPKMSDFNGSSDIENIANVAIWLLRPEYFDKYCDAQDKGILKVFILKNRWGMVPSMEIRLWCDMALSQVWDNPEPAEMKSSVNPNAIKVDDVSKTVDWDDIEIWD